MDHEAGQRPAAASMRAAPGRASIGGSPCLREAAVHHPPNHPNPTRRLRFTLEFQWGRGSGNIEKTHVEPLTPPARNSGLRVGLGWSGR
eukprot:5849611-Pyramimonas_sp.AAC.1